MEAAEISPPIDGVFLMAAPTEAHAEPVNNETPSQGIFMGYLALGLMIFAIAVAGFAIIAGASHGFS
jgi:hypothetical protein